MTDKPKLKIGYECEVCGWTKTGNEIQDFEHGCDDCTFGEKVAELIENYKKSWG